jgi:hypothetical protein
MTSFVVDVSRPAFSTGPSIGTWDIKIVKKTSMPNYDCRVKSDPLLSIAVNTPPVDKSYSVASSLSIALSPADVAALKASPAAASIAMGAGIATGLGISPDLVEVTSITYADGTVQTFGRRLAAGEVVVDYTVYSDAVGPQLSALAAGTGFAAMAAAIASQAAVYFEGFSGVTVTGAVAPAVTLMKLFAAFTMVVSSSDYLDFLARLPPSELLSLLTTTIGGILGVPPTEFAVSDVQVANLTEAGVFANLTATASPEIEEALTGLVDGASEAALLPINAIFEAVE